MTPAAEWDITPELTKRLLEEQFPAWATQPLHFIGSGWDNENYRLGTDYVVRLPRRASGAELMAHEIDCLPRLPRLLPIPIPLPLGVGKPSAYYPWPWSILPWFEGVNAAHALPRASEAPRLIEFLTLLHGVERPDFAPPNPYRSEPLALRDANIRARMDNLKTKTPLLTPHIEALWQSAIDAPLCTAQVLVHGDLHATNILIEAERFAAIIDWGDITVGDPAVDLASLWMLFPELDCRRAALRLYGATPDMIRRAVGWAVYYGVVLLDTGWNHNPEHERVGAAILERLAKEPLHL